MEAKLKFVCSYARIAGDTPEDVYANFERTNKEDYISGHLYCAIERVPFHSGPWDIFEITLPTDYGQKA